jgi:hypothetical protein
MSFHGQLVRPSSCPLFFSRHRTMWNCSNMIPSPPSDHGLPVPLIEGGLNLIAIAAAFRWPRLGHKFLSRIEHVFGRLARSQSLSVGFIGFAALLLRLAILPLSPIPEPYIPDDFSFLLAANTFALGRLTNLTPAMWPHFESFHIDMRPTYMSMYFPAQGLVLAAGKLLMGHPWYGQLCVNALMCAAICWMLQAWLPPPSALLGGILAILRLSLFSYWIDTYSGAGSIAALGGALVLGALPRFMRAAQFRHGLLLGLGVILLALSRPYEGILLCLPVAAVLAWWMLFGDNRPTMVTLLRRTAVPLALVAAAGAWMGYYNHRVFGGPLTPPYRINRATYAMAPYFVWQRQRPEPVYRHTVMRDFYYRNELVECEKIHTLTGFLPQTLLKASRGILFFSGIALLPPLIMLRRVVLDRRTRFLVVSVLILMAGMLVEIFLLPHYLAPFTAAFYAIGLQAMRHLRLWRPGRRPVGLVLARLTVSVCFVLAGLRLFAEPLHFDLPAWPAAGTTEWYGAGQQGTSRARVEAMLEQLPGPQLAIVRYSPSHLPRDEWVYNAPDIDRSKVIWAREMDAASNLELTRYCKDRKVWLVEPDMNPVGVSPYPIDQAGAVADPMTFSSMEEERSSEVRR